MRNNGTVPDIGWGEWLFLGAAALVLFGPDKLPKAAAEAGRMFRKLRELAAGAQKDLTDSGLDVSGLKDDLRQVAELHPKRLITQAMSDTPRPATTSRIPEPPTGDVPPTSASSSPVSGSSVPGVDPDAT